MKPHRISLPPADRQHGAALVVSLLLLLVMTLLGLGASQSTRLQERMAGNQRDQELALQGSEAALRDGERNVNPNRPQGALVKVCNLPGDVTCQGYDQRVLVDVETQDPLDLANQSDAWWTTWSREYAFADDLQQISGKPQYVVEKFTEVDEVLSASGTDYNAYREFFTVTARSSGQTDSARVVIQSSYARLNLN